jgi:hypothetical protein
VIYAKSEQLNMTGSIKDRMALYILQRAYADGQIRPGDTIVEATSGNTGISFAALGRALGHPVTIFMPDWMSRERVDLINSLGARIIPVTRAQGGFVGSIRLAEELAASRDDVFLPRQFSNGANVAAHECTTGPEIGWQRNFNHLTAVASAPAARSWEWGATCGRSIPPSGSTRSSRPSRRRCRPGTRPGTIGSRASRTSSFHPSSTWRRSTRWCSRLTATPS